MAVKEHPKGYRLDIQIRHYPKIRKVLRGVDEVEAKAIHDSVIAQLRSGIPKEELDFEAQNGSESLLVSRKLTVGEAFDQALRTKWRNRQSLPSYYSSLGKTTAERFGRDKRLAEVQLRDISNFVDVCLRKKDSPSTINHRLALLRNIWTYAIHHWEVPGVREIEWSYYRQRNKRYNRSREITPEEEKTILSLLRGFHNKGAQQMASLVQFALWTGLRRGELLALEVRDFERDYSRLRVSRSTGSPTTKTGQTRYIPVRGPAWEMVNELSAKAKEARRVRLFHELNGDRVKALWKKVRKAMNLESDRGFVFHALRHTSATRLARKGASTRHVQEWMGHADIKTTQRYTHLASNDLDNLADLIHQAPA